jgi:hypothetical protein
MHRYEISRANQPQDDDDDDDGRLGPKGRQYPRRSASLFEKTTLWYLVEFLLLGEHGAKSNAPQIVNLFVELAIGMREDAPRTVQAVAQKSQEELLEPRRAPDLQATKFGVRKYTRRTALSAPLADPLAIFEDPTP